MDEPDAKIDAALKAALLASTTRVREDVRPPAEPTQLNTEDACPHCRGFGFFTIVGASDLARAANPEQVYPYRAQCGNCQGTGRNLLTEARNIAAAEYTDRENATRRAIVCGEFDDFGVVKAPLAALRRGIELERNRALSHDTGDPVATAEPVQDTIDMRTLFAAYDAVDGPQFMAGAYDDGPSFERAIAALIAIKARVRCEEREAVCKWLRDVEPYYTGAAKRIERGEHRDTRP